MRTGKVRRKDGRTVGRRGCQEGEEGGGLCLEDKEVCCHGVVRKQEAASVFSLTFQGRGDTEQGKVYLIDLSSIWPRPTPFMYI